MQRGMIDTVIVGSDRIAAIAAKIAEAMIISSLCWAGTLRRNRRSNSKGELAAKFDLAKQEIVL
jgi:hypothetical protein